MLRKPDNDYDKEAIEVRVKGLGKVVFVIDDSAVCKITETGIEQTSTEANEVSMVS